jgi:hypothetical protein
VSTTSSCGTQVKPPTQAHTVPRFYLRGFVAPEPKNGIGPFLWVGSVRTGEINQRSPKSLSISPGFYDGPGGFEHAGASIEEHLGKIESAAATAIRKFVALAPGTTGTLPTEISRFLEWQAARTPGWMELEAKWIYNSDQDVVVPVAESPPEGIEAIRDRCRSCLMEDPKTGERREVRDAEELRAHKKVGWKQVLRLDDKLELLHMQAWYFQVRHFPRLSWVRLDAPENDFFITSDRAVAWIVDGCIDTPPAALRHPTTQVLAPLTRKVALIGKHGSDKLNFTAREVNRRIACTASKWLAGPTKEAVEQALGDRSAAFGSEASAASLM